MIAVLFIIGGSFTYFLGRMIQSKISRKREFFADIHAVRLQRLALPMGNLLRKLAADTGSDARLREDNQLLYQHFMFSGPFSSLFSTHPPIKARIRMIVNFENSGEIALPPRMPEPEPSAKPKKTNANSMSKILIPTVIMAQTLGTSMASMPQAIPLASNVAKTPDDQSTISTNENYEYSSSAIFSDAQKILSSLPDELMQALRSQESVAYIYYALILDKTDFEQKKQLSLFSKQEQDIILNFYNLIENSQLVHSYIIVELAYPALYKLSKSKRNYLIANIKKIAELGGKLNIRRYCLSFSLKILFLNIEDPKQNITKLTLNKVLDDVSYLLAIITHASGADILVRQRNFADQMANLYPNFKGDIPLLDAMWPEKLSSSLSKLMGLQASQKGLLIKSIMALVLSDNHITDEEYEVTRMLALCLDQPLPLRLI